MKDLSIYIHIPFCESKCIYCAFASFVSTDEQQKKYFDVLQKEIVDKTPKLKKYIVKTIFFGGGTPSVVDSKYIVDILNIIKEYYNVDKNAEITIECNPNSATLEKLTEYKKAGFNRVSFGIQSLDDSQLAFLNRKHTKQIALDAIYNARLAGFCNINADLLIGLIGQNKQNFEAQINQLIDSGITHISTYMIMVEKHTRLYSLKDKNKFLISDDNCVDLYNDIVKILRNKKMRRYEISNFAFSKNQCKHNLVYWNMGEYVGFGLAAHSYIFGKRVANTSNFDRYVDNTKCQSTHKVTDEEMREEFVMLALRTERGINLKKYEEMFSYNLLDEKKNEIEELLNHKLIEIKNNYLKIRQNHFGKSNLITIKLI